MRVITPSEASTKAPTSNLNISQNLMNCFDLLLPWLWTYFLKLLHHRQATLYGSELRRGAGGSWMPQVAFMASDILHWLTLGCYSPSHIPVERRFVELIYRFFFCFVLFWDRVLLSCPGWTQSPGLKCCSCLSLPSSRDYRYTLLLLADILHCGHRLCVT